MIVTDETHAVMDAEEFRRLPEYSCSIPTGKTIGKRWKRGEPYGHPEVWFLCEYVELDPPEPDRIGWTAHEILVVER